MIGTTDYDYFPPQVADEFVRDHHREKITVEQLAKRTGLSSRQLHRKFRVVFGMSVQDFLSKTRIQTARTIAEIAQEFGFCEQNAFTQQFRKHTGMTPLKFRRRYMTSLD